MADALNTQDNASDRAASKIERLRKRDGFKRLAAAVEARIALGVEGDAMGDQMLVWLKKWNENQTAIHTAWCDAKAGGMVPTPSMDSSRLVASFIPIPFQSPIARSGGVVRHGLYGEIGLGENTRNTWGHVLDHARKQAAEAI